MDDAQFILDLFLLGVAGTGAVLAVFYIKLRVKGLFIGFRKLKTEQDLARITNKSKIAKSVYTWWTTPSKPKLKVQRVSEFMVACQSGRLDEVRRIISAGVNVNATRAAGGKTALMLASQNGHIEVVRYLSKIGAHVNATGGRSGKTALIRACESRHLEVARILISHGANIDSRSTSSRKTALMGAVENGDLEMAHLLIRTGANVNAKNKYGETSLDIALKKSWDDLSELLKAYGAHFNKYHCQEEKGLEAADVDKYYAILKCKKTDGIEEIKAKYRSLVKQYHPDVIQGKGLPADFVEFANEKFQLIQQAYQYIIGNRDAG